MLTLLDARQMPGEITCTGPLADNLRSWSALPFAMLQISRWPEAAVRKGLSSNLHLTRKDGKTSVTSGTTLSFTAAREAENGVTLEIPEHHVLIRLTPEAR